MTYQTRRFSGARHMREGENASGGTCAENCRGVDPLLRACGRAALTAPLALWLGTALASSPVVALAEEAAGPEALEVQTLAEGDGGGAVVEEGASESAIEEVTESVVGDDTAGETVGEETVDECGADEPAGEQVAEAPVTETIAEKGDEVAVEATTTEQPVGEAVAEVIDSGPETREAAGAAAPAAAMLSAKSAALKAAPADGSSSADAADQADGAPDGVVTGTQLTAQATERTAIQNTDGTYSDVYWWVEDDGTLRIEGTGEVSTDWGEHYVPGKGRTEVYAPWLERSGDITSVKTSGGYAPTSLAYWFYDLENLETADLSGIDTSSVTDMPYMFYGCSVLTSLDVSGWDTSKAYYMEYMFDGCSSLESLDVSWWDTSKAYYTEFMFWGCSKLTSLDLSGWDTSSTQSTICMFAACPSLKTVWVSEGQFDTSKVENSVNMFYGCASIVGGAGTTYDAEHVDAAYAHVDGGEEDPGYFTLSVSVEGADVTAGALTYAGEGQEPSLTVEVGGVELDGDQYEVVGYRADDGVAGNSARLDAGGLPLSAGSYVAVIRGRNGYKDTVEVRFSVARAPLTITAGDATKAYGEADPALSATAEGLRGGDSLSTAVTRERGEDAGGYEVAVTAWAIRDAEGRGASANYDVTTRTGTFTITQASNSWTEAPAIDGWTYGEDASEPSSAAAYGAVSFAYYSDEACTQQVADLASAGAGTYYMRVTVAETANYAGLTAVVPFEVAQAEAVVSTEDRTVRYDGSPSRPPQ